METMATGQNCRHVVPRVVKVLKSGYDIVITPPGKNGGNCSKQRTDHENRLCAKEPCQGKIVRVVLGIMLYHMKFGLN